MCKVEFSTDNDAFNYDPQMETERVLHEVAEKIGNGETEGKVLDGNGNVVGSFTLIDR